MFRIILAIVLSAYAIMIVPAIAASPSEPQVVYSVPSVDAMHSLGAQYTSVHLPGYYEGSNRGGGCAADQMRSVLFAFG